SRQRAGAVRHGCPRLGERRAAVPRAPRQRGGLSRAHRPFAVSAAASPAAFQLALFRDFLALEAGNSANTVENYLRDVRRFADWATSQGKAEPSAVRSAEL